MRYAIALLAVSLLFVPAAGAETITSGFIGINTNFDADVQVSGGDFTLSGGGDGFLSNSLSGFANVALNPSTLVLNGTTYRPEGTLNLTADGSTFMASGHLTLFDASLFGQTLKEVGSFDLSGSGTVSAFRDENGDARSATYTFTDMGTGGTAPVPEPTSLLLLASGLAGLGLWRRRGGV